MQIDKIEIFNIGPYRREVIEIDQKPGVSIIWGDNGTGKTTLVNIIKYAFFGVFFGGKHKTNPKLKTFNKDAKDEGETSFSVRLKMRYNGDQYELIREQNLRDPTKVPTSDLDFKETVTLKKNSNVLNVDQSNKVLSEIMPKDISRFFFFDGELLSEYEELLEEDSDLGSIIKESIEKILGLPALKHGEKVLTDIKNDYQNKFVKSQRDEKSLSEETAAYDAVTEKIDQTRKKIVEDKAKREELIQKLESLREEMKSNEKIIRLTAEEKQLKATIEQTKPRLEKARTDLIANAPNLWKSMIKVRAQEAIGLIRGPLDELNKKSNDYQNYLKLKEGASICPVCKRPLDNAHELHAVDDLTPVERDKLQEYSNLNLKLRSLSNSQEYNLVVKTLEESYKQMESTIDSAEIRIKTIREEIGLTSEDTKEIEKIQVEHTRCAKELQGYEDAIKTLEEELSNDLATQQRLYDKIKTHSSPESKLIAKKRDVCEEIATILTKCKESYRDALKQKVEADASDLFFKMIDPGFYSALRINDNYGLDLIDLKGDIVPARSSGFEQMVAFALIGGIHKNAPIDGPTIIDYPFGRISGNNKLRVAKIFPELGKQVIFLPFFEEINENELRATLGDKLLREYKLNRVGTYMTHIEDY